MSTHHEDMTLQRLLGAARTGVAHMRPGDRMLLELRKDRGGVLHLCPPVIQMALELEEPEPVEGSRIAS